MGNTLIKANCVDQRLLLSTAPVLASGGINEDVVEFHFCPLWEGFSKTAVFYRDEKNIYYSVVGSDDRCTIPAEVLQSEGDMFFGVFGTSGSVTRTSEILRYKIKQGAITENLKPSEPAPDIYIQILEALSEMDNKVDKVDGKGLSTNDYTNAEKTKLAGIADGATKVIIDSTLEVAGQAADAKTTGDRLGAVEAFTINPQEYELTGNIIQLDNFDGMPMNCVTAIEPIQSGSGDPSPDNIRPISGWTGAKLTRCGKNLLDSTPLSDSTLSGITFSPGDDGYGTKVTGTSTTAWAQNNPTYYKTTVLPAGTYTFSTKIVGTTNGNNIGFMLRINGANAGSVTSSNRVMTKTFAVDTEIGFFCFLQQSAATVDCTAYFQAEAGSAAADYESFTGDSYAADFGETVYGGKLDWNTGVLTVDRALVTLTGEESCTLIASNVNGDYNQFNLGANPGSEITAGKAMCSHYKRDFNATANAGYPCFYDYSTSATVIRDAYSTVSDFKSYLAAQAAAGTPVQVCYKLATPTTVQLTPNEIHALAGANNIWSDAGETTVSGRKDILWLTSRLIERIKTLESAVISLGGNV